MAYEARDYSFLDEKLDGMEAPMNLDYSHKLIFSAKDKNKNPFKSGKKFKDIVLRILPPGTGKEILNEEPFKCVTRHWLETAKKFVECTQQTAGECPYCSAGAKSSRIYPVNVLVLNNPYQPDTKGEVKVFDLDWVLFQELFTSMKPVEEDVKPIFPHDLIKGHDFVLSGTVKVNTNGKASINWGGSSFVSKPTRISYLVDKDGAEPGDSLEDKKREPLTDEEIDEVLKKRHVLGESPKPARNAEGKAVTAKVKPVSKPKPADDDDEDDEEEVVVKKKKKADDETSNYFDDFK